MTSSEAASADRGSRGKPRARSRAASRPRKPTGRRGPRRAVVPPGTPPALRRSSPSAARDVETLAAASPVTQFMYHDLLAVETNRSSTGSGSAAPLVELAPRLGPWRELWLGMLSKTLLAGGAEPPRGEESRRVVAERLQHAERKLQLAHRSVRASRSRSRSTQRGRTHGEASEHHRRGPVGACRRSRGSCGRRSAISGAGSCTTDPSISFFRHVLTESHGEICRDPPRVATRSPCAESQRTLFAAPNGECYLRFGKTP